MSKEKPSWLKEWDEKPEDQRDDYEMDPEGPLGPEFREQLREAAMKKRRSGHGGYVPMSVYNAAWEWLQSKEKQQNQTLNAQQGNEDVSVPTKMKKDDGTFQNAGQKRALTQFFKLNEWRLVREGDEPETEAATTMAHQQTTNQQGPGNDDADKDGGVVTDVNAAAAAVAVAAAVEQVNPASGVVSAVADAPLGSNSNPAGDSGLNESGYYIKAKGDKKVICIWELEKVVYNFHCDCGHRGRDATFEALKDKVVGIPKLACGLVPPFSPQHKMKKVKGGRGSGGGGSKNSQSAGGNDGRKYARDMYWKRVQAELIDMTGAPSTCSSTGKEMRYLLHVYDHASRFKILRSVPDKSTKDLAWSLYEIFALIDAPTVLHVGNGDEQAARYIVEELQRLCPEFGSIVMGSPQSPAARQSVDQENARVTGQLQSYLQEKNLPFNSWSDIYQKVQLNMNKTFHTGQEDSPQHSVFGSSPKPRPIYSSPTGGVVVSESELSEEQKEELRGVTPAEADVGIVMNYEFNPTSNEQAGIFGTPATPLEAWFYTSSKKRKQSHQE
jgi:hypothetical protein